MNIGRVILLLYLAGMTLITLSFTIEDYNGRISVTESIIAFTVFTTIATASVIFLFKKPFAGMLLGTIHYTFIAIAGIFSALRDEGINYLTIVIILVILTFIITGLINAYKYQNLKNE